MKSPSRIPLSPCDYLVFNHHLLMRHKRQGEYLALMVLDVGAHVEPERIRAALARAMIAHPVMMADLRVSLLTGRPYWRIPRNLEESAARAAELVHAGHDLRDAADWAARLQQMIDASLSCRWPFSPGPPLRLDQYLLPDGRTRFCLRWPHFLMDADGAQLFLREVARLDAPRTGPPSAPAEFASAHQPPGTAPLDVLAGCSLPARLRLLRRGLAAQRRDPAVKIGNLYPSLYPPAAAHRLLHRVYAPEQVRRMQTRAQQLAPPGPGLYARYLAACTFRVLDRLYAERAVSTDAYLMTLPRRVALPVREGGGPAVRPVWGNYLVPLTLTALRGHVGDRRALGEDLLRQYQSLLEDRADASLWAMMWAVSRLRVGMYQAMMRLERGFAPMASGFSFYGEIDPPVRTFGGAEVLNLFGAGLAATPPGWNLAFSRFRDRLNVSLTYNLPAVPDDLARRYLDDLEHEVFTAD